jgi:tetratricopeptide (TPR) repeat protein
VPSTACHVWFFVHPSEPTYNTACGRTRRQAYEAAAAKEMGNRLFKAGLFAEAEEKYTQSLLALATDASVHTNRSAARAARGDWEGALDDALVAVELDARWTKVRLFSAPAMRGLKCSRLRQ